MRHWVLPRIIGLAAFLGAWMGFQSVGAQKPEATNAPEISRQISVAIERLPSERPIGRQWLVLIAIDDYANRAFLSKLSSCRSDAAALRDLLFSRFGYNKDQTIEIFDDKATAKNISRTLHDLVKKVASEDSVLILFSGHGYYEEDTRMGYWYPYEAEAIPDGIPNSTVRDWCRGFKACKVLVISDSCFSGSLLNTKGLQDDILRKSREILTSGGLHPVGDANSPDGKHSIFNYYLLQSLERLAAKGKPFVTTQLYVDLYDPVLNNSNQEPKRGAVLGADDEGGQFLFYPKSTSGMGILPMAPPPTPRLLNVPTFKTDDLEASEKKRRDEEAARKASEAESLRKFIVGAEDAFKALDEKDSSAYLAASEKAAKWREFLDSFSGKDDAADKQLAARFTRARERADHWANYIPPTPEPTKAAPSVARPSGKAQSSGKYLDVDCGGGVSMRLVRIPTGTFLMGSPESEKDRSGDEGPQTRVTLTQDFWMGEAEVTQGQYEAVMGNNPSNFKGDPNLPVETVSWNDAKAFCDKLSQKSNLKFVLPTEAQWEYACRAGTTTPFSFGETISTDQANYNGNYVYGNGKKGEYRQKTTPAKSLQSNAWGLYNMHGNVWEWCSDWYVDKLPGDSVTDPLGASSGSYRVFRGGSWFNDPGYCRSAHRNWITPVNRDSFLGFRAVAAVQESR